MCPYNWQKLVPASGTDDLKVTDVFQHSNYDPHGIYELLISQSGCKGAYKLEAVQALSRPARHFLKQNTAFQTLMAWPPGQWESALGPPHDIRTSHTSKHSSKYTAQNAK